MTLGVFAGRLIELRELSMRTLALAAVLLSFTGTTVYAQQAAGGRTCSGIKARCEQNCTGLKAKGRCSMNCDSVFNSCMQTGEWRGYKNTIPNVRRQ